MGSGGVLLTKEKRDDGGSVPESHQPERRSSRTASTRLLAEGALTVGASSSSGGSAPRPGSTRPARASRSLRPLGSTDVATGAFAKNPITSKHIPIWIANYVLASYGTGAVFACPAHDERDFSFATKFGLPIIEVVSGGTISEAAYTGDGPHVNSGFLDGLETDDAKRRMIEWLETEGRGEGTVEDPLVEHADVQALGGQSALRARLERDQEILVEIA